MTLPGATGPVTQVAAGFDHSLVVTATGQLYGFGTNRYGQLGTPANNGEEKPNPMPTLVTLPGATGPVTQVAAGRAHSLAVTSTGQLYAFGLNRFGQLGIEHDSGNEKANPTPTLVTLPGATGPVTQVAAGNEHSLAVTSTGQLYAFGENFFGQLGIETNSGPNPNPALVSLPAGAGPVSQIAAGIGDTLAVTSAGQLYGFGLNETGQLGSKINNGSTKANPTPALVALPAGATIDTVARGSAAEHTLALVADLAVSTASLPAGPAGIPYLASVQATGGTTPYRWTASGLPAGLSIDPASGVITGTPIGAGSASVVLRATDAYGISADSPAIALTISPALIPTSTFVLGPTAAQIRASLLSQIVPAGRAARITALLKSGYTVSFTALTAGTVVIDWYYLPKGAHVSRAKPKPVLVAAGRGSFSRAGSLKLKIKLTSRGRQLLKHAKRLQLTAKGTFTAAGNQPITAIRRFTLKR